MNAETWKTWSSDKSRICDGYVFATPDERRRYIRMLLRDRPRWLRENPERWRALRMFSRKPRNNWRRLSRARSMSNPYQQGRTIKRRPVRFGKTAMMKTPSHGGYVQLRVNRFTSAMSEMRPLFTRSRPNRGRLVTSVSGQGTKSLRDSEASGLSEIYNHVRRRFQ
jgi:hypothetical protein